MNELITGLFQESISGIALGCIYALIALGFTLIYKASEVVNFAQGEVMMVGAYVNFFFVSYFSSIMGEVNGWVFLLAFLGMALCISLLLIALKNADAGIVATLSSTSPIMILFLIWLITNKMPTKGAWFGTLIAIIGTGLIFLY